MVSERIGFKKRYDLTERVLPDSIDTSMPDESELARFVVLRALRALGLAAEKDILRFLQPEAVRDADMQFVEKAILVRTLKELAGQENILTVRVEGDEKNRYVTTADTLEEAEQPVASEPALYILSPFDNLIIRRERTARLFGFEYTLECYVPAAKRKFGYFVHPILFGDRFAGRLDPKADRKHRVFIVNRLVFEPGFQADDRFMRLLAGKLAEMAQFNGCDAVRLNHTVRKRIRDRIGPVLTALEVQE